MKEHNTIVAKTIQQHNKKSCHRPKLQNGYMIKSHIKLFINLNRLTFTSYVVINQQKL